MAHPYDDNGFRHYLKFYDFDMDWYEIAEPIGFDGAKYVKKQLANRWTRDVEYFAIDGLTFPDSFGDILATPRVYNPQGDLSSYMDYGLWYLLENRRLKGSEIKVGYKISRNGVDFREFELDNRDDDLTDGETYYKAKLVEKKIEKVIEDEGEQGESGLSYEVYKITEELFIRLTINTNSYGDDEFINGIEFVKPKEKNIVVYETI